MCFHSFWTVKLWHRGISGFGKRQYLLVKSIRGAPKSKGAKHLREPYHYNTTADSSPADRARNIYHSHLSAVSQRASGPSVFLPHTRPKQPITAWGPEDTEASVASTKCVTRPSVNLPNGPSTAHSGTLVQLSAVAARQREDRAKLTWSFCSISIVKTVTHALGGDGRHTCGATKEIDRVGKNVSGGIKCCAITFFLPEVWARLIHNQLFLFSVAFEFVKCHHAASQHWRASHCQLIATCC